MRQHLLNKDLLFSCVDTYVNFFLSSHANVCICVNFRYKMLEVMGLLACTRFEYKRAACYGSRSFNSTAIVAFASNLNVLYSTWNSHSSSQLWFWASAQWPAPPAKKNREIALNGYFYSTFLFYVDFFSPFKKHLLSANLCV